MPTNNPRISPYSWDILLAISAGGSLGALARYGLARTYPPAYGHFPWATFITNIAGSFLIGVLVVMVSGVWSHQRLVKPFLGVGVLGGFTTFSTYIIDIHHLVDTGSSGTAVVYLGGTIVTVLLAVSIGMRFTALFLLDRRHKPLAKPESNP